MKIYKIYFLISFLIVFLSIGVGIILICMDFETVEKQFRTFDELQKENFIDTGYVPKWLPSFLTNISISYNFDYNTSYGYAEFDVIKFTEQLNDCIISNKLKRIKKPLGFMELDSNKTLFYKADPFYVAINFQKGEIQFYQKQLLNRAVVKSISSNEVNSNCRNKIIKIKSNNEKIR